MDLQLIAVATIGIFVAIKIVQRVYRFFFEKKETGFCGNCSACLSNPNKSVIYQGKSKTLTNITSIKRN